MNNNISEQIKTLFENEAFVEKFTNAEDLSEIKQLFADNGVEMSDDEVKQFVEAVLSLAEKGVGEMSEDQLDNVAGGFVGWVVLGVAAGVVGGTCAYKLRKKLNSVSGTCNTK